MAPEHLRLVNPSPADDTPPVQERDLRVLLVENHVRIKQGLAAILGGESGIEIVEEQIDPSLLLDRIHHWRPDVISVAVQLDGEGGFELLDRLHQEAPEARIIVLTMQRSAAFAQRALRRGAIGVVLKDRADSELIPAVRAAAADESYVSPRIAVR